MLNRRYSRIVSVAANLLIAVAVAADGDREEQPAVTPFLTYVGDLTGPLAGYHHGSTGDLVADDHVRYRHFAEAGVEMATVGAGLWEGGTALVSVQNGRGWGSECGLARIAPASNIDAGNTTHLGEMWYEHAFAGDRLHIRAGRQYVENEFAHPAAAGDFMVGAYPTVLNARVSAYPEPTLAVSLSAEHRSGVHVGGSVFGTGTSDQPPGSVIEVRASGGDAFAGGVVRCGYWYEPAVRGAAPEEQDPGTYGVYGILEGELASAASADWPRRLTGFAVAAWTPPDRSDVPLFLGSGMVLSGWMPGRRDDSIGCAVAWMDVDGELGMCGEKWELVSEAYVRVQVVGGFAIVADVQYVRHIGGWTSLGAGTDAWHDTNGLTGGLRVLIEL